jgi:hypothetical protein
MMIGAGVGACVPGSPQLASAVAISNTKVSARTRYMELVSQSSDRLDRDLCVYAAALFCPIIAHDAAFLPIRLTTPHPDQRGQRPYDQNDTPAQVARHQQPHDTVFVSSEALSKGKEEGASCQVACRPDAELSTMENGSTSLAAVIGTPHASYGEEIKAFVICKAGATITEEELIGWCKENMAAYKYPRMIEFRDSLPMTATGKILKRELN